MSRIVYLKLSAILAALLLSGCTTLQPRLGFNEALRGREAALQESRDPGARQPPVELNGTAERGNIHFSAKFPVFVW